MKKVKNYHAEMFLISVKETKKLTALLAEVAGVNWGGTNWGVV